MSEAQTQTLTVAEILCSIKDISGLSDDSCLLVNHILSLSKHISITTLDDDTLCAIVLSICKFCEEVISTLNDITHKCYEIEFSNTDQTLKNAV